MLAEAGFLDVRLRCTASKGLGREAGTSLRLEDSGRQALVAPLILIEQCEQIKEAIEN